MVNALSHSQGRAVDSQTGRLQAQNERDLIRIERILAAPELNANAALIIDIRNWYAKERVQNQGDGDYTIDWKRLYALLKNDPTLQERVLQNCEPYKEYVEAVNDGRIVPTPTPPTVAVVDVDRGRKTVRQGVAALYGKQTTPKPPVVK
jgi:hypothetical protein